MQSRNSKLILCPFCFFDKIDNPFCLQNCFFLLAAHFAQILLSKFCQGLVIAMKQCSQCLTEKKVQHDAYQGQEHQYVKLFKTASLLSKSSNKGCRHFIRHFLARPDAELRTRRLEYPDHIRGGRTKSAKRFLSPGPNPRADQIRCDTGVTVKSVRANIGPGGPNLLAF